MALNLHPADLSDLEKIAEATSFAAHLRIGPHDKVVKRAKTLAAAIRAADALSKTPSGRKALIYAITADKQSIHVPVDRPGAQRRCHSSPQRPEESRRCSQGGPQGRCRPRSGAARRTACRAQFQPRDAQSLRGKLAQLVALVEPGDVAGLKGIEIMPYSSSPKAMARYRDLAIVAIEAHATS
ncbi:hypothetical protein NKI12_20085 [Mesorhizobium australicum]|uniref:Uncharacterized protein n=1 Tax=Mesorhizobium australicum TaxID=536018 RepID=A0ACC6T1E3_9HYPH